MKQLDYGMVFLVQAVMLSGSIMFLYCYFGEMATQSFESISDVLYESNWQNLSLQLQKYYILMIGNAQRPLHYHGFHVSILSLNTFAKVMLNFNSFSIVEWFEHNFQFKIYIL